MKRRVCLQILTAAVACLPALCGFRGSRVRIKRLARLVPQKEAPETGVLEFTVTSEEPFPVRAVDPVLRIGTEELAGYRYENSRTLVFKGVESEQLRDGAEMILQYGKDEETRTELGRFRRSEIE